MTKTTATTTTTNSEMEDKLKLAGSTSEMSYLDSLVQVQRQSPTFQVDLQAPPRVIFTSCCWCPANGTWPQCQKGRMTKQINYFRSRGLDAVFVQMPCSKTKKRPDLEDPSLSKEFYKYASYLQKAHARGDVIINTIGGYVNSCGAKKCCQSTEVSNYWVEYALTGGKNRKHTEDVFMLQNKKHLRTVFENAGLSHRIPKTYSADEVSKGDVQYPVVIKTVRGFHGYGVHVAHNATHFEQVMSRHISNRQETQKTEVEVIVQEALIGDQSYVTHYMTRWDSKNENVAVSYWCGIYKKESWKGQGTFVQVDGYTPVRVDCHPDDVQALTKIIRHTKLLQSVGCVDGKNTNGPGTMKFFDWNVRMCGSWNNDVMKDLLVGLNTSYKA